MNPFKEFYTNRRKFWIVTGILFVIVFSFLAVGQASVEYWRGFQDPLYTVETSRLLWNKPVHQFLFYLAVATSGAGALPFIIWVYKKHIENIIQTSIAQNWSTYTGRLQLVNYVESADPLDTDSIHQVMDLFFAPQAESAPKNNVVALDWTNPVYWILAANEMQQYLAIQNQWKMENIAAQRKITRFFIFEEYSEKYLDVIFPNLINGVDVYLVNISCIEQDIEECGEAFSQIDKTVLEYHLVYDPSLKGRDIAILDLDYENRIANTVTNIHGKRVNGYIEPDNNQVPGNPKLAMIENSVMIAPFVDLIHRIIGKYNATCACRACNQTSDTFSYTSDEPRPIQGCYCLTFFNSEEFRKKPRFFTTRYRKYNQKMITVST